VDIADGTSQETQLSAREDGRHGNMKHDVNQYYEAVLGITREAGKVSTWNLHTLPPFPEPSLHRD